MVMEKHCVQLSLPFQGSPYPCNGAWGKKDEWRGGSMGVHHWTPHLPGGLVAHQCGGHYALGEKVGRSGSSLMAQLSISPHTEQIIWVWSPEMQSGEWKPVFLTLLHARWPWHLEEIRMCHFLCSMSADCLWHPYFVCLENMGRGDFLQELF